MATRSASSSQKLLIVESPAKIKTISKFLGKDFKIMSTFGHVKDLPSKKLGVSFDAKTGDIGIDYVIIDGKENAVAEIAKQASRSSEVYLASDPDREGEIISWHIGQEIAKVFKNKDKIYRITFNEITKTAVQAAIENKSSIDMNMVEAQQARRVLDRWVGYEVSPILWKKITKGLSAGRVQSVALLLVCKRDEEIKNFKPEESWSIHGDFGFAKAVIPGDLVKIKGKTAKLKNKKQADETLAAVKKESYSVSEIKEKERSKRALPPFMTSTLQQDAYNKLGFSVDKTMMVAQKLYEGIPLGNANQPEALITYMRTDSLRISNTALTETRSFIDGTYGADYVPSKTQVYAKGGAQDAHEAVRPISVSVSPQRVQAHATRDQAALYGLIWRRFVACQMSPAKFFQRTVHIEGGDYLFRATGSTLMFDGFLKVYKVEDENEEKAVKIPKGVEEGLGLDLKKAENKQHFTQPPPRYSEATLVKELEKQGVGRPSTFVATLSTIKRRKYVEVEKKRFNPTELGTTVNDMLVKNLPDLINVSFTAKMEEDLDKIANGTAERDKILTDFYTKFSKDLEAFSGTKSGKTPITTDKVCPKCKQNLVFRFDKAGEFLGCPGFPECTFTSNFTRDEKGGIVFAEREQAPEVDIDCPQCGKKLVQKIGKYGPFLTCPGYPDCKYIHQESLKMACPDCGSKVVKRKWRGGTFWGCSGYPKCRFAVFGDVEETPCPECSKPYLLTKTDKKGVTTLSCSDKSCGYTKKG